MMALDFEQPVAALEEQIENLRFAVTGQGISVAEDIARLEDKAQLLTRQIYAGLTPSQTLAVARHPARPYTQDYLPILLDGFQELHGDRHEADDPAIIGGMGRLDGRAVIAIGHRKGRDTKERTARRFGMPNPEGYRKALRLMHLGAKFGLPVVTFIDTPGAFPGISAEERNQSEAIARNLFEMARLPVPIVATVIGEGGSGGALAIGVADRVNMLSNSVYSVISPEGCASILFKSATRAPEAAAAMRMTAPDQLAAGLIDEIVPEPAGGAHRHFATVAAALKATVSAQLDALCRLSTPDLLARRYQRLRAYGRFEERAVADLTTVDRLESRRA